MILYEVCKYVMKGMVLYFIYFVSKQSAALKRFFNLGGIHQHSLDYYVSLDH